MSRQFTLEYWVDDSWFIGRIKEIPGVFSQGESLTELEENIRDAYKMVMEENDSMHHTSFQVKELELEL